METRPASALKESVPPAEMVGEAAGNYFVAVYPPFSTWEASQVEAVESLLDRPGPTAPLGLYIHIPFCQKKCDFCYYLSFAGVEGPEVSDYVESLLEELELHAERPAVRGRAVSFVYFGGGTPSILEPDRIRSLGRGLQGILPWTSAREVTFECAPRTVREEAVGALREIGVTRVSLGVQSFDDGLLRRNGRVHLGSDAVKAYGLIRRAGFRCVNVDLMAGLPGETAGLWEETVRRALELSPDSVTVYQTEMPHNTRAYANYRDGRLAGGFIPWAEKRERVARAFEELEGAGYTVTSGYAAVKDPTRHAFVYQQELWGGADMLGLGVACFSYFQGAHFQNITSFDGRRARLEARRLPLLRARLLGDDEQLVREFIFQLKLGFASRRRFLEKFGADVLDRFAEPIAAMEAEGWLEADGEGVKPTRIGLVRIDALLSRFYRPEHRGLRYT